jgi:hypothetical protein
MLKCVYILGGPVDDQLLRRLVPDLHTNYLTSNTSVWHQPSRVLHRPVGLNTFLLVDIFRQS